MIFGLPDPVRLRRAVDMLGSLPRRQLSRLMPRRDRLRLREEPVWLTNAAGYRIHAHVHDPADDLPRPAVVLVPGRDQAGKVFCAGSYLLTADELAARGIRTVHFDPVGRGRSWGHDDFCGEQGQDSLRAVLDYVHARRDVLQDRVGVASFSMGLALAAPLLVREGRRLGTRFLLDWEGPADREAILRTGPLPPAARTALAADPGHFWAVREPVRWIDQVPCAYVRLQGWNDHGLGRRGRTGAIALVAEATAGAARYTRLNGNRPDAAWRLESADVLDWAPEAAGPLNRRLVDEIAGLLEEPDV